MVEAYISGSLKIIRGSTTEPLASIGQRNGFHCLERQAVVKERLKPRESDLALHRAALEKLGVSSEDIERLSSASDTATGGSLKAVGAIGENEVYGITVGDRFKDLIVLESEEKTES